MFNKKSIVMIKHYLTICFRNLKKYQSQSIISIVGLSIGFLSFMLCNYYVQYHLFFNTKIPDADRMYVLTSELTESDLYKEFPEIETIFTAPSPYGYGIISQRREYTMNIEDKDVSLMAFFSDALNISFIDIFSLEVVHGTKEMITRTDNGVVLFESEAKKLAKNLNSLIGKELKPDNGITYQITGILKNPPENSTLGIWKKNYFVFGQDTRPTLPAFSISGGYKPKNMHYLLINKNVSKKYFINKVEQYFNREKGENETENQYELKPFTGLSNFSEYSINIYKFLFIFGLLILLSTLFNFILFQFSMYYNHLREYGIRIVNGVNRWQFALQLFVDVVVRFLLSCLIVFFFLFSFFHLFEKTYYDLTYINLDLSLLMAQLMKYILYGSLLSLVFSYVLSHNLLKQSVRSVSGYLIRKNNRNMGRNILLLLQLVIIVIFISAAGIVKLQINSMKRDIFSNLTQKEREKIITFRCSYSQLRGKLEILSQKISNSNHVLDVTLSNEDIISMWWWSDAMKINGIDDHTVREYGVASNFIDFFNGQIIQGNTFESDMDYDAAIVHKNFMKLFPGESLIGKNFLYKFSSNKSYRIIGVFDNIQIFLINFTDGVEEVQNITEKEVVFFRLLSPNQSYCTFYVKCIAGKTKEAKKDIKNCLKEFIPETYEIEIETLQEKVDNTFSTEKLITYSSVLLFVISLILGLLNIYSSVLMSVEKRRKEIAIRIINGAEFKDIVILLGKTYFILWTVACFVSFPFIYRYATLWLERYQEPITLNVLLFVMIYIIILALIILIVISQIIKTTKANPADVIKSEE